MLVLGFGPRQAILMTELKNARDLLLGRALPAQIRSYTVERYVHGGPSYADYVAHHRTLGHSLLFQHERWPSPQSAQSGRSLDPIMDRATELDALDGLRRARRLQAELQHPRILPVVDFFEHEAEWFSVFSRIADSRFLSEIITSIQSDQRPPCAIAEFVALSAGVTDGLAAIHRAGFVHRTLGTHNVLVDSHGYVRLADMGCATPVGADDAAARAFRRFMRPASAAPEQFDIEGTFSPATDTWALGVMLFELRYGRHPFWSDAPATVEGVREAIVERELTFQTVATDKAERLLQPWLRRLLERDPQHRYIDALEAQRDLQAIASEIEMQRPVARAFVAIPFATAFEALWRAIWSACEACRVSATRIDQSHFRENIWDEICDAISSHDFTIAVATPESSGVSNPNVMLEIGYARALHKPVLLLTDSPNTLPFDLRTQRALCYETTPVSGGEFHRKLVSLVAGVVARCVTDKAPASVDPPAGP